MAKATKKAAKKAAATPAAKKPGSRKKTTPGADQLEGGKTGQAWERGEMVPALPND